MRITPSIDSSLCQVVIKLSSTGAYVVLNILEDISVHVIPNSNTFIHERACVGTLRMCSTPPAHTNSLTMDVPNIHTYPCTKCMFIGTQTFVHQLMCPHTLVWEPFSVLQTHTATLVSAFNFLTCLFYLNKFSTCNNSPALGSHEL